MSTLAPPERFTTDRLCLRRIAAGDADALFTDYASDPDVTRYLAWRPHRHRRETERFVAACAESWRSGDGFVFALADDGTGPAFGTIGLRLRQPHETEYGFALARRRWGQGLMTEALSCLVAWSLAQPGVWRASAYCDAENAASARIMEKAGLRFEGRRRRFAVHPNIGPEPRDCLGFARVRDDPDR